MDQLPTTRPRIFCFVLMPFEKRFDDVYQIGIKESCADAGAYCERADEQIFQERILDRIYNQIAKADCVIADMTDRNANVFYEVGYAHALGKPTILLTQRAEDIPFDLKHFPHIVYGGSLIELREQLTRRVRWFVENPPTVMAALRDPFEIFIQSKSIDSGQAILQLESNHYFHVEATLRNASSGVLEPGRIKAGIITSPELTDVRNKDVRSTSLPDGRILHLLPDFPELLPDEFTPILLVFNYTAPKHKMDIPVTLRILTERGSRDFPVLIRHPGTESGETKTGPS